MLPDSVESGLVAGSTVLTAGNRLARELQHQHNQVQMEKGVQAWSTPNILPYQTWIRNTWLWSRQWGHDFQHWISIDSLQAAEIWDQVIRSDLANYQPDTEPLWNLAATSRSAMYAWRLCREWQIDPRTFSDSPADDHSGFARWATAFETQCKRNKWIDPDSLPTVLTELLQAGLSAPCDEVFHIGFNVITPQMQALLDNLARSGCAISSESIPDTTPENAGRFLSFDSEYQQWLAAAQWARQQLETNPECRIGIVAPDIQGSREMIESVFTDVLAPDISLDPDLAAGKPFHLALGKPLADQPVIAVAIDLLTLASGLPLESGNWSRIIRSSFIGSADTEYHSRSQFEQLARSSLQMPARVPEMQAWLQRDSRISGVSEFASLLTAACDASDALSGENNPSSWVDMLLEYLAGWGWPGDRTLESTEFQAVVAFRKEANLIRRLDLVSSTSSAAAVSRKLSQRVRDRIFEPESPEVKVEIMGIHEATGMSFDAVWFGNLTDRDWPPAPKLSPLIPITVQKSSGIPQATPARNFDLAREMHCRLLSNIEMVVTSYPLFESDVELLPTPLVARESEPGKPGPGLLEQLQAQAPAMDVLIDTLGGSTAAGATRGGIAVIQDQSSCPFRAFATHRLGCRTVESRNPGLDARQRGSLLHRILEKAWQEIQSSENLSSTPKETLSVSLADWIQDVLKSHYHATGLGAGFQLVMRDALERLLQAWFDVERARDQTWRIAALEQVSQLKLGPLLLEFQIDRIDKLEDGSLALIDYKSGMSDPVSKWTGSRPHSVQLPLYLLSCSGQDTQSPAPVSALMFAQVRAGDTCYRGLSRDDAFQRDDAPSIRVRSLADSALSTDQTDWEELVTEWKQHLGELAYQFRDGFAAVDPLGGACDYCSLQAFCRISEAGDDIG